MRSRLKHHEFLTKWMKPEHVPSGLPKSRKQISKISNVSAEKSTNTYRHMYLFVLEQPIFALLCAFFFFWKSLSEAELYHTIMNIYFKDRFLKERKRESGFQNIINNFSSAKIHVITWIEPASTHELHGCLFLFSLRSPWCSEARLYAVVKILFA